jgi:hypothetical protein
MELATDRIIENRQFSEPSFQVAGSHPGVTPLLPVPINRIDGIVGR